MVARPPAIGIDLGTTCGRAAWVDSTGATRVVQFRHDGPVRGVRPHASELPDPYAPENAGPTLKSLRTLLEGWIDGPPYDAVIAVPAGLTREQRQTLHEATMAAGFSARFVPTPVAAAVAQMGDEIEAAHQTVLVFDMGARTTEVAVVRFDGQAALLASGSSQEACGAAFDEALARWLAEQVRQRFGLQISDDPRQQSQLHRIAERAKIELSTRERAWVPLCELFPRESQTLELSRAEFDGLTAPLIASATNFVFQAIQTAECIGRVDGAVLAGGGALTPRISRMLEEHGYTVCCPGDPMEAAVRGAARVAARLREFPADDLGASRPAMKLTERLPAASSPPTPSPAPTAPPARHVDQNVQFTTYCPRTVRPETYYTVLAFAHLDELPPDAADDAPDPVEEVKRQARQALGGAIAGYRDATHESAQPVPREAELTFVLDLEGFRCNPRRHTILWEEPVHRVEFRIRAPESLDGQTCRGRMSVFLGDILLAEAVLRIEVTRRESQPRPQRTDVRPYRRIFASYSRRDMAIVEQFERYGAALGDRYLRDLVDLRAGEEWNERLMRMIDEADVFQLFWSQQSMRSPFVRQEWEYALSLGRKNFVRPMYWEQPFPEAPPALPPNELRAMHFQLLGRYEPASPGVETPATERQPGALAAEQALPRSTRDAEKRAAPAPAAGTTRQPPSVNPPIDRKLPDGTGQWSIRSMPQAPPASMRPAGGRPFGLTGCAVAMVLGLFAAWILLKFLGVLSG